MALCPPEENLSDEEVFFGNLSLKEAKKRIFLNISCTTEDNKFNVSDDSIKLIETHSEPDIISIRDNSFNMDSNSNQVFFPKPDTDWDVKSTDDSFLRLEKMVTEMCVSPKSNEKKELDNTLEVVEFILNNAPLKDNITENIEEPCIIGEKINFDTVEKYTSSDNINSMNKDQIKNENDDEVKTITQLQLDSLHGTPLRIPSNTVENIHVLNSKTNVISTTIFKEQAKDLFKTPKTTAPLKTYLSSTKKTPGKINAYQHITSPVASYIKNCPQVPLLRDVHPKKPLPGCSSIPKLVKSTCDKGKENVMLPSVAYKSAKKTKMITIPDKEKLPQSPWAKQLASSLPKPLVIKHDHREVTSMKKSMIYQKDDSFADLSLRQADLSVCTQKSAVSKP